MNQITIVVPCFNEEEVLRQFHQRVNEVLSAIEDCSFRLLFINDGSRDSTLSMIQQMAEEDPKVSYISFSRNFGKESAMLAGLDYADGDAVIIMDADLQHPPELIPEMLRYWREGYEDVCAKRTDRKDEGYVKGKLTNLFYYLLQKSSRTEIQRNVGDFRLLDMRCVAALRLMRERERYTKGLRLQEERNPFSCGAARSGENYVELLVSHESGTGRDHFFYYGTASSGIYDGRGGFYIGYFVYDLCLG